MSFEWSLEGKRIYVAGHRGMVGSALIRRLVREDCEVLVAEPRVDLRDQATVQDWFARNRPDAVLLAAARVGGIQVNDSRPGEFLYDNLMIATNVIEAARAGRCERLLFLGSSCIYPRLAPLPIAEDALLTGPLEPTNQWYAVAKIAGIKLCQAYRRQYGCDFISAMPTNLYGPGDNYDPDGSHVLPALIRKADEAKRAEADTLTIWGTGTPRREFLHVDDLAEACVFLLRAYSDEEHVNVGSGSDLSIMELAELVSAAVGYDGRIRTDPGKPNGTPRKLMDSARIRAMGWTPQIALSEGIADAYRDYLDRFDSPELAR